MVRMTSEEYTQYIKARCEANERATERLNIRVDDIAKDCTERQRLTGQLIAENLQQQKQLDDVERRLKEEIEIMQGRLTSHSGRIDSLISSVTASKAAKDAKANMLKWIAPVLTAGVFFVLGGLGDLFLQHFGKL
jgi:hypothetical protein